MKIAKRDLAILMVVFGLLAVFCSYKFYFSGALKAVDEEKTKQADLQTKIDAVAAVAGTETQMNNEVKKWGDEISDVMEKYDPLYVIEDGILWMKQIENDLTDEKTGTLTLIQQYNIGEPAISNNVVGQGDFEGKSYYKGATSYSFSYSVTDYDGLKSFIDYIVSGKDGVKTLDSMSFTVDTATGATTGTVNMTVFIMSDGSKEYSFPTINVDGTGITNIFGEPTGEEEDEK